MPKNTISNFEERLATARALASSFPLSESWRLCEDFDKRSYFFNLVTRESSWISPAHKLLEEIVSLMDEPPPSPQPFGPGKQVSPIQWAANEYMRRAHHKSSREMLEWAGPYTAEGDGSVYYHHTGYAASVWHNPAKEMEAELQLRQDLLACFLKETPGPSPKEWSEKKGIQVDSGENVRVEAVKRPHEGKRRRETGSKATERRGGTTQSSSSSSSSSLQAKERCHKSHDTGKHFFSAGFKRYGQVGVVVVLSLINLHLLAKNLGGVSEVHQDDVAIEDFIERERHEQVRQRAQEQLARSKKKVSSPRAHKMAEAIEKAETNVYDLAPAHSRVDAADSSLMQHYSGHPAHLSLPRAPERTPSIRTKSMRKRLDLPTISLLEAPAGPVRLFPLAQKLQVDEGCCAKLDATTPAKVIVDGEDTAGLTRSAAKRAESMLLSMADSTGSTSSWELNPALVWTLTSVHVKIIGKKPAGGYPDGWFVDPQNWAYSLNCSRTRETAVGSCTIKAESPAGALAALQSTLPQLFAHQGHGNFQRLFVEDRPNYGVRGLSVDLGRRFVPLETLLHEVVDGMALVKMNYLQLHLSDFCRFSIDLPGMPELNHSLQGITEGQYSPDEIKKLLAYANERGIAVVPEVDVPGHANPLMALKARKLAFCEPPEGSRPRPEEAAKIYDDPAGKSRAVLRDLIKETSSLFSQQMNGAPRWFHVGGDEANPLQTCSQTNIADLERYLVKDIVHGELNHTAVAWEELRLKRPDDLGMSAAGDSTETIIIPWHTGSARQILAKGHRAIVANLENHYLDFDYVSHPVHNFWYDITSSRPAPLGQPEDPHCLHDLWEKAENRYLGGNFGGAAGTTMSYEEAVKVCNDLGRICTGITCERAGPPSEALPTQGCQPRRGSPYLADSSTEDSWVRTCADEPDIVKDRLLGAISAMWTDKYCYVFQCGAADPSWGPGEHNPIAHKLFSRSFDESFRTSMAGLIWPRAGVTAATLWKYDETLSSDDLASSASFLAAFLRERGVRSCPSGCMCDELHACGTPYPVLSATSEKASSETATAPPATLLSLSSSSRAAPSSHRTNKSMASSTYLEIAANASDDVLSGCYSPGVVDNLGALLDSSLFHSPRDARRLCFWMGHRCHGVRCSAADSAHGPPHSAKWRQLQSDDDSNLPESTASGAASAAASSSSGSSSSSSSSSSDLSGRPLAANDDASKTHVTMTSLRWTGNRTTAATAGAAAARGNDKEEAAAATKSTVLSCSFHERGGTMPGFLSQTADEIWVKEQAGKCPYDLELRRRRHHR